MKIVLFSLLIFLFMGSSCKKKDAESTLFELLNPKDTGIDFENNVEEDDSLNVCELDYIYNGGGVAIGDFNGDGLADIFFTGNKVSNRLYLNQGNMQFQDVTPEAGLTSNVWSEGVTVIDIDNDGHLDIYVSVSNRDETAMSPNLLYVHQGINDQGIPMFKEEAAAYGLDDRGYNTQASFFDYDLDGHLDLYILSNAIESFQRNTSRPREMTGKGKDRKSVV